MLPWKPKSIVTKPLSKDLKLLKYFKKRFLLDLILKLIFALESLLSKYSSILE